MTDNGFKKMAGSNETEVRKWEFEEIKQALITTALDGTEVLLNYMYEKKFNLWVASDEYKKFTSLLIRTGTDFDDQYKLFQPMRTFFSIRSNMADAQKMYMREAIGKDLLAYLVGLEDPPGESLAPAVNELKKALAYFTIKECCKHQHVRFSDQGFSIISDFGSTDSANEFGRKDAGAEYLKIKMESCEETGQTFLSMAIQSLVDYFNTAADDDFDIAFIMGPLKNFVPAADRESGNRTRIGVFGMP